MVQIGDIIDEDEESDEEDSNGDESDEEERDDKKSNEEEFAKHNHKVFDEEFKDLKVPHQLKRFSFEVILYFEGKN